MWRGFIPRPFYMIELWEYEVRNNLKLQYQDLKSVFIESISVNTDFFWRRGKLV